MYNSDKPIEDFKDDILGRGTFAKQLAKAIISLSTTDNFTIGLFGKWGSGKTSIINMAEKEIERLSKDMPEDKSPIVVRFEPWNFTDSNNLILQFFKYLRNQLDIKDNSKLKRNIGEALQSYSSAIESTMSIPVISSHISDLIPFSGIIKSSMKFIGVLFKNNAAENDLLKAKEKLAELLRKPDRKIVIIIDDIDRLTNNQIRLIFQLVNSVAGLPNLVYVLSMDKEVVIRALKSVQECDGNEYLEKIIQMPFEVPQMDKIRLLYLFLDKLQKILKGKIGDYFNKEYWKDALKYCIEPNISSIRDVNRILNAFEFKYDMIYSEVNFIDMLIITILQVKEPQVLQWIMDHKHELCTYYTPYNGKNEKEKYLNRLKDICNNPEIIEDLISVLFPKFGYKIGFSSELYSDNQLIRELRIANINKFELYFNLDINNIFISRAKVKESILTMEYDQIEDLIIDLNFKGKIIYYIEDLRSLIKEIPYNRIQLFIKVFCKNLYKLYGYDIKYSLKISDRSKAEGFIESLISQLKSKVEKYEIYKYIIENGDLEVLRFIGRLINIIEISFGRLACKEESDIKEEHEITLDQLISLEKIYSNRVLYIAKEKSLFNIDNLSIIMYLWKNFNKNTYKEYMINLLKDDINVLNFIIRISSLWRGANEQRWSFDKENYEEFISGERVIECIEKMINSSEIKNFNDEELVKLATFILNEKHENRTHSFGHASEQESRNLVIEWKRKNKYLKERCVVI